MGRKKKETTEIKQEEVVTNYQATNQVSYQGEVTITKIVSGKKQRVNNIKNTGTKQLFSFLVDCLSGTFMDANVPYNLRLGQKVDNIFTEKATTYVPTTSITTNKTAQDSCSITKIFRVPESILASNSTINCLRIYPRLMSSDLNEYAAEINLTQDQQIVIVNPSNQITYEIDWVMTISNKN